MHLIVAQLNHHPRSFKIMFKVSERQDNIIILAMVKNAAFLELLSLSAFKGLTFLNF